MEKLIKSTNGQWTLIKGDEISAPGILPKWTRPESQVYPIKTTAQINRVARAHQDTNSVAKKRAKGIEQPRVRSKNKLNPKNKKPILESRGAVISNNTGVVNLANVDGPTGGTVKHEAFHVLVNHVDKKYGKDASHKMVDHVFNSMHPEHQELIMDYARALHPDADEKLLREEAIAHTISARNSKYSRDSFVNMHKDNFTQRELDRGLKTSYKAIIKRLKTLEPYEITDE